MSEIRKVAVIGGGTMGNGIAQVFAMEGYSVNLVDVSEEFLRKAIQSIEWSLNKFVERGRIRVDEVEAVISRIKTTTSYEEAACDIDLAVEAVPENIELKKKVFAKIDEIAPSHAIIATNTSTLSITEMGNATRRPQKAVGMHWFNPPQLMQLIEVIKGEKTNDETVRAIMNLSRKLGKTPILCKKDVKGFIVNRVLTSALNEALWAFHCGEATKEGIDFSIKYRGGFPMGWFELCDLVGLDVVHEVGKVLYEAYGERFKPCPDVIEPLLNERRLGRKTGVGFYDWTKGRPTISPELSDEYDVERLWAAAINEAAWLIYDDVADPESIDVGMKLGAGWPQGPCEHADKERLDVMLNKLKELFNMYNMEMYKPCPLLEEYVARGWIGRVARRGFYQY